MVTIFVRSYRVRISVENQTIVIKTFGKNNSPRNVAEKAMEDLEQGIGVKVIF